LIDDNISPRKVAEKKRKRERERERERERKRKIQF